MIKIRKKESEPKVKKIKVKKERVPFRKSNFTIKSNLMFYLIVLLYSVALGTICYLKLGLLVTGVLMVLYFILILFAMILDRYHRKAGIRRLVKALFTIIIIFGILGIMATGAFFTYVAISAPKFDAKKLSVDESTIVYDKSNKIIATLGANKREKLDYNELSQVLIDAVIATEDSRFFQHNGLDAPRFAKAAIGQVLGRDAGGGSTLTMQVSKNNFTSFEAGGIEGIIRKFTDIYLSIFKLERYYTKEEIIEFYVNKPFLGSQSYGVEQAAKTYFGKDAKDLNLSEAAIIAGLFQSPSGYDPNLHPKAAENRRKTVLSLMKRHGYITAEEETLANAIPISQLLIDYSSTTSPYQGYLDLVLNEVEQKTGMNPYKTPMFIYTNMDTKKQEKLNDIMDGKGGYKWKDNYIQCGVAAIEVKTGKVFAIGAGRNRKGERTFSYATDMNRQIGSTAKPIFDYGPAIEFNNWSTAEMLNDAKWHYSNGGSLRNWDGKYRGWLTMRQALQQSRNIPALKTFQKTDNAKIAEFVKSLGITPEEDSTGYLHEAHALGGFNGSNPLQMAAAFAAFSNGGYYFEPYSVNRIVLRNDDSKEYKFSSKGKRVMSEATAYMITNVLYTGVGGSIGVSKVSGVPLAAKTGTTDYPKEILNKYKMHSAINDAWIVGYSPTIAIGMWYGYENIDPKHYNTMSSASSARKKLYYKISSALMDKTSPWKQPSSVIKVGIEKVADLNKKLDLKESLPLMLPSEYTPSSQIMYELFRKGTEPTERSPRYVPIDNPTNLLVTYTSSQATLTWNAAHGNSNVDTDIYGDLGYEVYYNGAYLGFTTLTTYTYDTTYPFGTYVVKTAYQKVKDNRSSGAEYTLVKDASQVHLTLRINGEYTTTLSVGTNYQEPAVPVNVYDNLIDVTSNSTITKTIYNPHGEVIGSSISALNSNNTESGTYKILYKATYLGKTATATKYVKYE